MTGSGKFLRRQRHWLFSVSQVARRYAINANLIHKWILDQRFDGVANDEANIPAVNGFSWVEIEDVEVGSDMTAPVVLANAFQTPLRATRVDFTHSDGRWVLIEGPTALVLSRFSSGLF